MSQETALDYVAVRITAMLRDALAEAERAAAVRLSAERIEAEQRAIKDAEDREAEAHRLSELLRGRGSPSAASLCGGSGGR